ncbi:MAG: large subunit ribosomal protein L21 [Parcubacteria group bacterium Gr01-1014_3]|nr:MAG: large subunit ribosomal protein L21 [Parcubacteria group bacterium Gr01-1014_3]
MNLAVIETGGKQYVVTLGQKLKIEKLEAEVNGNIVFDKVLMTTDGDDVKVGAPYVSGAKVDAKVITQNRHKKLIVFKYHSKTRQRKKKGHRQYFTEVEITSIK